MSDWVTYYHLTSAVKLNGIMRDGLLPDVGSNSSKVGEDVNMVYLCKEDDVPYWKLILDRDTLLEVRISSDTNIDRYAYGYYTEYLYPYVIPAEQLRLVAMTLVPMHIYDVLRLEYLMTCSTVINDVVRRYHHKQPFDEAYVFGLDATCNNYIATMSRLNYADANRTRLSNCLLREANEGETTLCDLYANTTQRFYQVFEAICKDNNCSGGLKLVNFLKQYLGDVLNTDTGGSLG